MWLKDPALFEDHILYQAKVLQIILMARQHALIIPALELALIFKSNADSHLCPTATDAGKIFSWGR